jgi:hypothetical protein
MCHTTQVIHSDYPYAVTYSLGRSMALEGSEQGKNNEETAGLVIYTSYFTVIDMLTR